MHGPNITETAIRQLLQQANELLPLPADILLERVLEGGGHQTWYVGDDMILRLGICGNNDSPGEIRARQKREAAIRKYLNGCYSLEGHEKIIPECLVLRDVEWHDVVSFCVDKRIRGTSLEVMSPTPATIDGLARLLKMLKSTSKVDTQKLGLPRIPTPDPRHLYQSSCQAWMRLINDEQLSHTLREYDFIEVMKENAHFHSDYSWLLINNSVFLHGDLKGEHILLNPDDGALVGALDWEDAGIGHASIDINGLTISVGASCAAGIGTRAGYDTNVVLGGIFLAQCKTVMRLEERLHGETKIVPRSF